MKNLTSVLIIYNPNALKGKIDEYLPQIKQRLLLRYPQVDCMAGQTLNGAEEIAIKYSSKYDIVVACGGDGTIHQVINGVRKSGANPIVGVLPCGTCNDVARELEIPFDLQKATDCILRLNTKKHDLMFDGNEYITYTLATGYLTKTSYSASSNSKKRFGRFAYVLSALNCLFKFEALPITVTADGERIHGKFAYFMLINGQTAGGFKLNKNDITDDGKVKLIMIKKKGLGSFFAFVRLFLFGINSVRKSKYVIVRDVSKVEIENHANSPFTLDGEKCKFLKKTVVAETAITFIKK
ncbi:MAG: YegS/Rv2252/BmrU family lipid kinase [Clostridia bacterium]|nr:YegS/Rv2252/BmrU family lipid kinase [Clostridia bacterium]